MLLISSLALPPPIDGLRVLSLDLRRSLLADKFRKVRVKVNAGFLFEFVNGNCIFLEVASMFRNPCVPEESHSPYILKIRV